MADASNRRDNTGALTLQEYRSFGFDQHLNWISQFAISTDTLLASVPEEVTLPTPRRWRGREPRISLMGDTPAAGPARFEIDVAD
jgi:hypothetical protein